MQNLIDHLPHESATKTALRDAVDPAELAARAELAAKAQRGHGPFSRTDYLITAVMDRLDQLTEAVYRTGKFTGFKATPYPRPGVLPPQQKPALSPTDKAAMEKRRADHAARRTAALAAKEAVPDA